MDVMINSEVSWGMKYEHTLLVVNTIMLYTASAGYFHYMLQDVELLSSMFFCPGLSTRHFGSTP